MAFQIKDAVGHSEPGCTCSYGKTGGRSHGRGNVPEVSGYSAFLLADHGIVAMGKGPLEAEHTAELIEETAQVAILDKLVEKLGI